MSSPNPYNPQGQQPLGQYNAPNPYDKQPGRFVSPVDDGLDAIPMKKSNPLAVLLIAGGAVLVLGVAAFSFMGGKKKTVPIEHAAAVIGNQADEAAKAKAAREHLEITRRSLENLEKTQPQAAPEKAAPAPADEPKEAKAGAAARPGAARPVARPAPIAQAPAPKPVNKAVAKKKMDSLDDLGKDITGELGK